MSILSPSDVLKMVSDQQSLSQRVTASCYPTQSDKSLSTLLKLSEELRSYSAQNRAFAEKLRRNAQEQRAKSAQL